MIQLRFITAISILLGVISLPTSALAQVDSDLQRGIQLINDMEDGKAVEALQKALTNSGNSKELNAQIRLYLWVAHSNLGDEATSEDNLRQAFTLSPDIDPPKNISPKMLKHFETRKAEFKAQSEKAAAAASPAALAPTATAVPTAADDLSKKTSETTTPAQPEMVKGKTNWPAWGLLGGAVALGAVGIVFGVMSRDDLDKANDLTTPTDVGLDYHDKASSKSLMANICWGAAGAAAITSGILFYMGRETKPNTVQTTIVPLPHGALVQFNGLAW